MIEGPTLASSSNCVSGKFLMSTYYPPISERTVALLVSAAHYVNAGLDDEFDSTECNQQYSAEENCIRSGAARYGQNRRPVPRKRK